MDYDKETFAEEIGRVISRIYAAIAELRPPVSLEPTPLDPIGYAARIACGKNYTYLDETRDLLIQKNDAYGDSALNPLRIFSKADSAEQIRVRIDDKLSRIRRGHAAGEDAERDLVGYLILLVVAEERLKDGQ